MIPICTTTDHPCIKAPSEPVYPAGFPWGGH
nr:MAG TPA: hypothetical protein [Bacteriophage sp.]